MGTIYFLVLFKSYFHLVDCTRCLHDTMVCFLGAFWGLVCKYIIWAFEFITRYSFRYSKGENYKKKIDSDCDVVHELEDDQLSPEIDLGLKSWKVKDCNKSFGETESSVLMEPAITTSKYMFMPGNNVTGFMEESKVLSFKFTIHEVGLGSNDDFYTESAIIKSTGKDFGEVDFEKEDVIKKKTEDSAGINRGVEVLVNEEHGINGDIRLMDETSENDSLSISSDDGTDEDLSSGSITGHEIEGHVSFQISDGNKDDSKDEKKEDTAEINNSVEFLVSEEHDINKVIQVTDETSELENDSLSITSSEDDGMFTEMHEMDSNDEDLSSCSITGLEIEGDSFKILSDETKDESKDEEQNVHHEEIEDTAEINRDIEGLVTEEQENNKALRLIDEIKIAVLEIDHLNDNDQSDKIESKTLQTSSDDSASTHDISRDEIICEVHKIDSTDDSLSNSSNDEETQDHSSDTIVKDDEKVSEDEFTALDPQSDSFFDGFLSEQIFEKTIPDDISEKSQEPEPEEEVPSVSNPEDEAGFEVLHAHQDYIKQLKNELKQGKNKGLPTIDEESEESPKIVEDMKPMKINTKMEHKDAIEEIQKLYKSYAHKMRKLDVLSNQTMHAIDLLKLQDPAQLISAKKSSTPVLKSLLSQKFRLSKVRNDDNKPNKKFMKELQKDFELVYIGQVCLSWEILHWQHRKAQELQNFDPHAFRQYNHVADLYQQFQVLLQRFIEDEPFQKRSRIENYIDHRCVFRSFLQVPLIKDEKPKQEGEYAISIGMLTAISRESMRLFWDFIRADKDCTDGTHADLKEPADLELLMDIQTNYHKKEKKLKEALRSRTCIVKRLQNNKENEMNPRLLYAQIVLKLVGKVLNMSKLTRDQLVWCHRKIEEVNFSRRNVCTTPSFLLFPC